MINHEELRFKIFQHATEMSQQEYYSSLSFVEKWNAVNSTKIDYPKYPSVEYVQEIGNKIYNFVSK